MGFGFSLEDVTSVRYVTNENQKSGNYSQQVFNLKCVHITLVPCYNANILDSFRTYAPSILA